MKKIRYFVMISIVSLFIINGNIASAATPNIPSDAVKFKSHYYKYYDNNSNWNEAKLFCERMGGHLATITSEEENIFLYNYIISLGNENAYFGLTDEESEGVWKWITNEPLIYSNWDEGEPNNESGNENYGMFYWKSDNGTWNDGNFGNGTNDGGTGFLCEWELKCFEKRISNYYYTGVQLEERINTIEGNLIIDKPLVIPNGTSIEADKITIKSNVVLSKNAKIISKKDISITSNGMLDLSNGGEILCNGNFTVSGNGNLKDMDTNSKIEIKKDFIYKSDNKSYLNNGKIIVRKNINLIKNFESSNKNIIKLQGNKMHEISGDESCKIAILDITECNMGKMKLNGNCSFKSIKFPIATTKADKKVVDFFTLAAYNQKNDKILNSAISSVLYSIICDKSLKKDLLKNFFSGNNFEGIATYTSEEFSIPVIIETKKDVYERGVVSGTLIGLDKVSFGSAEYSSFSKPKNKYKVKFSTSKLVSDKALKKFLKGINEGTQKEIETQAQKCFTSYAICSLSNIFDSIKFEKGVLVCKLLDKEMFLEDLKDTFQYLSEY